MQERRTTIRLSHRSPAQQCSSEDLLPQDGYLINISERGAGLLARQAYRDGERVTVSFALPGEREPLTATGVVRWSAPSTTRNRWNPSGLEWLPFEEPTRDRLHRSLQRMTRAAFPRAVPKSRVSAQRAVLFTGIAGGLLIALLLSFWVRSLRQENRALATAVAQRNGIISQLEGEEARRTLELDTARANLAATASEVARLDQQTQNFGAALGQLNEDMERFQQSYVQVRGEREQLMQRVLDLEQERASLAKRLSSVEELRLAIREAIDTRKDTQHAQRLLLVRAKQEAGQRRMADGNRGFLIRDGRPTAGRATLWIRVHEPEPSSPQPAP